MKLISTLLSLSIILLGAFSMAQSYQKQIDSLENVKSKCISEEDFDCAKNAKNLKAQYEKLQKAIEDEDFELAKKIKSNLSDFEVKTKNSESRIIVIGSKFLNDTYYYDARVTTAMNADGFYISVNGGKRRRIHANDSLMFIVKDTVVTISFTCGIRSTRITKHITHSVDYCVIANFRQNGIYMPFLILQEVNIQTANKDFNYSIVNESIEKPKETETTIFIEKLYGYGYMRDVYFDGEIILSSAVKKTYFNIRTTKKNQNLQFIQAKEKYKRTQKYFISAFEEIQFTPGKKYHLRIKWDNGQNKTVCELKELDEAEVQNLKNEYEEVQLK